MRSHVISAGRMDAGAHPVAGAGTSRPRRWLADPRLYQIASLAGLLTYGTLSLGFDVTLERSLVILVTVLATQVLCSRLAGIPFETKSALISGLSLCLLFRSHLTGLAVVAGSLTIASKFVLRWNGKHVFNPTNLGLVAMMLASDQVWVSPGQWGSTALFGFLMVCLGGLVVYRAERSDVTWAFLASYLSLLFGRAAWLGDPLAIPLHQVSSGALLLFSFFMISDPKTTPDSRLGRVLFAMLVALGAGFVQFRFFRPNGLLWSLAVCSLLVPLIDRILPGRRYAWRPDSSRAGSSEKGNSHASAPDRLGMPGRLPALG